MFFYDFRTFLVKFFQILGFRRFIQDVKIIEGFIMTKQIHF